MGRRSISYELGAGVYITDWANGNGSDPARVTGRFNIPEDMTDAVASAIVAAIGGTVTRINGVLQPGANGNTPCFSLAAFRPRKIVTRRENGNTFSFILPDRANFAAVLTAVQNAVNGIGTAGGNVDCFDLVGEEWFNILNNLNATPGAPTLAPQITPPAGSARNSIYYNGTFPYVTDFPVGLVQTTSFKILTDTVSSPPSFLTTEINGCLPTPSVNVDNPCPDTSSLVTRRYTATTGFDPGTGITDYQTTEVPVESSNAGDINQCGVDLANNTTVVCLRYNGEDKRRLTV